MAKDRKRFPVGRAIACVMAPALAGVAQRLVCQYEPCGLELLAASLHRIAGTVALLMAGIILLIVRSITRRKRKAKAAK